MRIRKRAVPFPLSSLSPIPLTDPQLNRSPVVQQHKQDSIQAYPDGNLSVQEDNTRFQPSDQPNQSLSPHSDLRLMIGRGRTGWVCSNAGEAQKEKMECLELQGKEVEDERGREGEKSNDIRKGSILGAEAGIGFLPLSSSSHQAVGRWCEGDKAVPLKKRRGSFERRVSEETIMEKEKKMKAKMKTKMNKKCVSENGDEQEEREAKEGFDTASVKKRGRGGALMEGSRCSRVNGRGWRCCQQTLVGYSLCEHHLGKGRLRSMTSVRSRAMAATIPKKDDTEGLSRSFSSLREKQPERALLDDDDVEEEDEKKPLMITKKRMKIGMVKARSLSSLLGQTNNAIAVADNNKYGNV